MLSRGFFGGGTKKKAKGKAATRAESSPRPTYGDVSSAESADELPPQVADPDELSKKIDVHSREYNEQDDVPLRNSNDRPNPLNPPPVQRYRKEGERRDIQPQSNCSTESPAIPTSSDDLRFQQLEFDFRFPLLKKDQGHASSTMPKNTKVDLNAELKLNEAGSQYAQELQQAENTIQVFYSDSVPHDNRKSIKEWDDLKSVVDRNLLANIKNIYPSPNPLQARSILCMLTEQQLLVETPTGTGKTAAYLIPAVQLTLNAKQRNYRERVPYTLIIGNTNNLMHQVFDLAKRLTRYDTTIDRSPLDIRLLPCFAGAVGRLNEQQGQAELCVCTMGKLKDVVERGIITLGYVELLILDEADKMFENNFRDDLLWLHNEIMNQKRIRFEPDINNDEVDHPLLRYQFAAFSATFKRVGESLLFNEVQNTLYRQEIPTCIHMQPSNLIEQRVIKLSHPKLNRPLTSYFWQRVHLLLTSIDADLLGQNATKDSEFFSKRTIVFVEKKITCTFLTVYLTLKGYKFKMVNGDMNHRATQDVLNELSTGSIQGVVATNKLARGADIPGVEHIIVLEMAPDFDDYLHRIGRAGRVGNEGRSTLIFHPYYDLRHADRLFECLEDRQQRVPKWLKYLVSSNEQNRMMLLQQDAEIEQGQSEDEEGEDWWQEDEYVQDSIGMAENNLYCPSSNGETSEPE